MATHSVFLPGESQGRGSLVAIVYGVAQSRTRLKRLSSSSSSILSSEILQNRRREKLLRLLCKRAEREELKQEY